MVPDFLTLRHPITELIISLRHFGEIGSVFIRVLSHRKCDSIFFNIKREETVLSGETVISQFEMVFIFYNMQQLSF